MSWQAYIDSNLLASGQVTREFLSPTTASLGEANSSSEARLGASSGWSTQGGVGERAAVHHQHH